MDRPLYALTLHRPWAALIVEKVKPIENRSWAPPAPQLARGQWFAIHAGKTWDDACIPFAVENGVAEDWFTPERRVESAIVGVARYDGHVTASTDPWFFGPVGWQLGDAVAIEPVPCRGAQKLWRVPADVADAVRAAFRKARGSARA